jgi:PAS domain S-box-containing protein
MQRPDFNKGQIKEDNNPSGVPIQGRVHAPPAFSNSQWPDADPPPLSSTGNMPDVVFALDEAGRILTINRSVEAYGFTVKELLGHVFIDWICPDDQHRVAASLFDGLATKEDYVRTLQFRVVTKSNAVRRVESNSMVRFTPGGEFIVIEGVIRDITDNIQTQDALLKDPPELEEQVRIRTAELFKANKELKKEILERRETERKLRKREADFEMETANLQETNTALKVLLKRRQVDKQGFEEQVMYNVKKFILPYLDMLKGTAIDARQEAYLRILEINLGDVTSAFSRGLSLEFYGLTTSELKVANFIRQGKRTREIAALTGLSQRTIEAYRMSIRRKLRIINKKVNLRTMLMSMQ